MTVGTSSGPTLKRSLISPLTTLPHPIRSPGYGGCLPRGCTQWRWRMRSASRRPPQNNPGALRIGESDGEGGRASLLGNPYLTALTAFGRFWQRSKKTIDRRKARKKGGVEVRDHYHKWGGVQKSPTLPLLPSSAHADQLR